MVLVIVVSARILVVRIAANTVVIPVQGQRLINAAQVAILSEEVSGYYTVVSGTQVLALDVGVVGFPVVGVLVFIGGRAVGEFSGGAVLVGLCQVAFWVYQAGYAASGVIR